MVLAGARLPALSLFLVVSAAALPARADPAFTLDRATVSAGVRYGSEDLNLGVGVRGGYTLSPSVYVGAAFDYWFGEKEEQTVPGAGTVSAEANGWDLMGEAGYDFGISPTLVIRPFGGIGVFHAEGQACAPVVGCVEVSDSEAAGEVGGLLLVGLDGLNLGADVRLLFAEETAAVLGASIGADF